jgi:TolB protein
VVILLRSAKAALGCAAILLVWPAIAAASFPGANGKIAFQSFDDGGVVTINQDGTGRGLLEAGASFPSWSPDGSKLAYVKANAIWVANANGSGDAQVIPAPATQPAWSPDGTKIAYVENGNDNADIWVANADGTDPTRLTFNPIDFAPCVTNPFSPEDYECPESRSPEWSPNGTKIAFSHQESAEQGFGFVPGVPQVDVMNTDGTGRITVAGDTPEGFGADWPTWSPDGERIAFAHFDCFCIVGPPDLTDYLAIVNANGTGEHKIPNTGEDYYPAWSPDGLWIVYTGASGPGLTKIRPNGSGKAVVSSEGFTPDPDWQPIQNLGLDPYPRPGGGSPLRVALVPAYAQCTTAAQNSNHVAPLALDSCSPPAQSSQLLTTSTTGSGSGFARLVTIPGLISTPADEADFRIEASVTDVRNASDGSDYTGDLLLSIGARITNKRSGFGGVPATVEDASFGAPLSCLATAGAAGSDCSVSTTADTLLPSSVLERKRTIVDVRSITVTDAGADGNADAAGCPLACGTGDEQTFLDQGLFTP